MPTIKFPGIEAKEVKKFAKSISEYIRLLKRDGFAAGAGDNGAINVWLDKKGMYHGEHYVYGIKKNFCQVDSVKSLEKWLKIYYPQIL